MSNVKKNVKAESNETRIERKPLTLVRETVRSMPIQTGIKTGCRCHMVSVTQ